MTVGVASFGVAGSYWPQLSSDITALDGRLSTAETDIDALEAASGQATQTVVTDPVGATALPLAADGGPIVIRLTNGDTGNVSVTLPDPTGVADGALTAALAVHTSGDRRVDISSAGVIDGTAVVSQPITIDSSERTSYRWLALSDEWHMLEWDADLDARLPAVIEPAAILRGALTGDKYEHAGKNWPYIDPSYYGITQDGTTDDGAAWQDLIDDVPSTECRGVLISGLSVVDNRRLIFPASDTNNGGLSVFGTGMNHLKTGFDLRGAGAGLAVANYSADDATPGQITGVVPLGAPLGNFAIYARAGVENPLWIGYCGHLVVRDLYMFGGIRQIMVSEAQDISVENVVLSGDRTQTLSNITVNHGTHGNRWQNLYCLGSRGNVINFLSDPTNASGTVNGVGSGKQLFNRCIFDHGELLDEAIRMESGWDSEFSECRINVGSSGSQSGDADIPIIRTVAPPGGNDLPQKRTVFRNSILRRVDSLPVGVYLCEQEAGSGDPLEFVGCEVQNMNVQPLYRSAVGDVIAKDMKYTNCAAVTVADDVEQFEMVRLGVNDAMEYAGWQGWIGRTITVGTATECRVKQEPFTVARATSASQEVVSVPNTDPITVTPISPNGTTGTPTSAIPVGFIDSGGGVTAAAANQVTGGRLYLDPSTLTYYYQYGRVEYTGTPDNMSRWIMQDEYYVVAPILRNMLFLGFLAATVGADYSVGANSRVYLAGQR